MSWEFDGITFPSPEARAHYIGQDKVGRQKWRDDHASMKPPLPNNIVVPSTPVALPPVKCSADVDVGARVHLDKNMPAADAAGLLRILAPEGPWTVRTISSIEGGPPQLPRRLGFYLGPANAGDRENGIRGWITAAEAGKQNCYLHVAVARPDAAEKAKLSKGDVLGSRACWVDIDPIGERFEESRAEIRAAMEAEDPPFSCIVDSGNGYQAYKFIEPFRIEGDPAKLADLESRNLAISQSMAKRLEGTGIKVDACHSADHLMRLPGSTNFLTARKRDEKHYPEGDRPVRIVIWRPELVYKLEDLPAVGANKSSGDRILGSGDDGRGSITSDQLKAMLHGLDPINFREGARWRSLLWACHHGTKGAGREVFVEWSASDPQFVDERDKTGKAWDRADDERVDGVTVATLYHELKLAGRAELIPHETDSRPHIHYDAKELHDVVFKMGMAFANVEAPIYQSGGRLVHVHRFDQQTEADGVHRPAGALAIHDVSTERLHLYSTEHIRWTKTVVDKKTGEFKTVQCGPPKQASASFLAAKDKWRMRVLRGITECPTLRADGTVLWKPGYDRDSGLILDTNGIEFPAIKDKPTKQDALDAIKVIDKVVQGFPFDGHRNGIVKCASRSVALSLILSALAGRTVPCIPLHLLDAPSPGTGKSLLADCSSIIATGRVAAKMSQGRDEAEDEKRLTGVLVQGDPQLVIDNVEQPIGGDFLNSIITEAVVQVRILGSTGQVRVPANVLIVATGNNIRVKGDMTRRAIKCRLDARVERPEERRFPLDLKAFVTEHRTALVIAGLTILRAFAVADDRKDILVQLTPYGQGNFDLWNERVRGALVWLGEADPCLSRESIRDDDPVTASLATLIAAWVADLKTAKVTEGSDHGWYTTGQVCAAADEVDPQDRGALVRPSLHRAIGAIMPRGISPEGLGRFLSRYVGRIVGDYRLCKRQHPVTREKQYLAEPVNKADGQASKGAGSAECGFDFGPVGEKAP